MSALTALLTLVVALLTQVQSNPQMSPELKAQALSTATVVLQYVSEHASDIAVSTPDAASTPIIINVPTPEPSSAQAHEPSPMPPIFLEDPTYTTKDEGNGYWSITYSWRTNMPTTANVATSEHRGDFDSFVIQNTAPRTGAVVPLPEATQHTFTLERYGEPLMWIGIRIMANGENTDWTPYESMPRVPQSQ